MLTINDLAPGNTFVFRRDLRSTINNSSFFTITITAIPEPSTYVAAIGLLALMLWPLCRRWHGKVS